MNNEYRDHSEWIPKIKRGEDSRRLVWVCKECGYISRSRTRYCAGCGNPMWKGVKNADTEK